MVKDGVGLLLKKEGAPQFVFLTPISVSLQN